MIFALGVFGMIAMVALIIEGGNVFAQQRIAQNGSDSAATSGALVVAEKLSGATRSGADVANAVNASATANSVTVTSAEYTDDFGRPIGATVDPTGPIPPNARGVLVTSDRVADTTFGKILSVNTMRASAEATVVAGALSLQCVA